VIHEEAPGMPLYTSSISAWTHLQAAVEELERRIPGLFSGPECPLTFENGVGCSCTYEEGCKALKDKVNKNT
jgi:hypothetical protein